MASQQTEDLRAGRRFEFGKNWSHFLRELNEDRIQQAEKSLREYLQVDDLQGKRFLDIGSGSGLFSLAARRLGAKIQSFDYDPDSVACTVELRQRYFPNDSQWSIEQGSVLDAEFMVSLGQADVVYSWGVLHHTGEMRQAMENAGDRVCDGGKLFIAIYNDQGRTSRVWWLIKTAYNRLPARFRWVVLWPALIRLWGPTTIRDFSSGRPFSTWNNYSQGSWRGMSAWRDVVDWVGGLPFEVASPEGIFEFYKKRGFKLETLKTCGGGRGCNEFVFQK